MLVRNQERDVPQDESALVSLDALRAAQARLTGVARRTPMVEADFPGHGRVYLKAESLQPIGSFKLRGAYNKAASLPEAELRRGLITYSSGNHAQGVAYAARRLGVKAVIVMPSNAPEVKRRATEALGAEIVMVGPSSSERKERAEELAARHGYAIVPPYDDPAIIAGQGTCGLEIAEQLADVDIVLVPAGGGGLASGIATAMHHVRPGVEVWGVEPELAADATESMASGAVVSYTAEQTSRTLADGLRTQHIGRQNFAHLRAYLRGMVTVSEPEILQAMMAAMLHAKLIVEPSGAVALAAALFHAEELQTAGKTVCAVVSGGNVEPELLLTVLHAKEDARAKETTLPPR